MKLREVVEAAMQRTEVTKDSPPSEDDYRVTRWVVEAHECLDRIVKAGGIKGLEERVFRMLPMLNMGGEPSDE